MASLIAGMFDTHVLDPALLAAEGYVLLSDDMHFRQWAEAAPAVKGVWLQSVFAFAQEIGEIGHDRYADLFVKLAWRRHGHLAIDLKARFDAFEADTVTNLPDFQALASFIGSKNAEMKSHLDVVMTFVNHIWENRRASDVEPMKATGILLEKLIRHTEENWALTLAFVKSGANGALQQYIDDWIRGHFLRAADFAYAEAEIKEMTRRVAARRAGKVGSTAKGRNARRGRRSKRRMPRL